MKQWMAVIIAAVILGVFPASAAGAAQPLFRIGSGDAACEEEIVVPITLADSGSVASFTLDIAYDASKLQPVGVTGTELLDGQLTFNPQYRSSTLRVVYASARNIGATGEIMLLTLRVNAYQKGGTDAALTGSIVFAGNQELESVGASAEHGVVHISPNPDHDASAEKTLLVSSAVTTGKAEVDVVVSAADAPDACSGSFTIVYDDGLDVVRCEKGSLLKDMIVMINPESSRNRIKVNFMGAEPLSEAGELLRIRLCPKSGSVKTCRVSIQGAAFYRFDESPVPLRLTDGAVEVRVSESGAGGAGTADAPARTEPPREDTPRDTEWAVPFSDVSQRAWYCDSVRFAVENGLMKGVSPTRFSPDHALTRAELVTVLYRCEKEPDAGGGSAFLDVKPEAYYADAVAWARNNEIVKGVSEQRFLPDSHISREQIAAILYRYARYKAYDVSAAERAELTAYRDCRDISAYAEDAMRYMVGSGLMKGTSESTLSPLDNATRAEIAAILHRFLTAYSS